VRTTIAAAAAVGLAALGLLSPAAARADVDPTDYYGELRQDGFLVDGNQQYLMELAMIVCNLENAGETLGQIGDYLDRRENLPDDKGFKLAMYASLDICLQLHPRLVP
jgi:hypothetical protein